MRTFSGLFLQAALKLRSPLTDVETTYNHLFTSNLVVFQHLFLSCHLTNRVFLTWETFLFLQSSHWAALRFKVTCSSVHCDNLCPSFPCLGIWYSRSSITENQKPVNIWQKHLHSLLIREIQFETIVRSVLAIRLLIILLFLTFTCLILFHNSKNRGKKEILLFFAFGSQSIEVGMR